MDVFPPQILINNAGRIKRDCGNKNTDTHTKSNLKIKGNYVSYHKIICSYTYIPKITFDEYLMG